MPTTSEKIIEIARKSGVLRPKDLDAYDIPRRYLSRLYQNGLLERVGRGLYVAGDVEPTQNHTIVQVGKRVPNGVICLLSALQFHELTSQLPFEVWIAIDRTARRPKEPELPIRIVRFSGAALTQGVEKHQMEGVTIQRNRVLV